MAPGSSVRPVWSCPSSLPGFLSSLTQAPDKSGADSFISMKLWKKLCPRLQFLHLPEITDSLSPGLHPDTLGMITCIPRRQHFEDVQVDCVNTHFKVHLFMD